MVRTYREALCWLMSHDGAVLVITSDFARVVDRHSRADGVHMKAARALLEPSRAVWFNGESKAGRTTLRPGAGAEMYHQQLVARRQCTCPKACAGGVS